MLFTSSTLTREHSLESKWLVIRKNRLCYWPTAKKNKKNGKKKTERAPPYPFNPDDRVWLNTASFAFTRKSSYWSSRIVHQFNHILSRGNNSISIQLTTVIPLCKIHWHFPDRKTRNSEKLKAMTRTVGEGGRKWIERKQIVVKSPTNILHYCFRVLFLIMFATCRPIWIVQ